MTCQQGLEFEEVGTKVHRPVRGVEVAGGLVLIIFVFVVADDSTHACGCYIDRRFDNGGRHADSGCGHRHGCTGHGDDSASVYTERAKQCEEKGSRHEAAGFVGAGVRPRQGGDEGRTRTSGA